MFGFLEMRKRQIKMPIMPSGGFVMYFFLSPSRKFESIVLPPIV